MGVCISSDVVRVAIVATVLLMTAGGLQAENLVKIEAADANPGDAGVLVPVKFTNDDAMEGYSLAITYDTEFLECTSVLEVAGYDPEFFEFSIDDEEGTVVIGVILALEPEDPTTIDASPDDLVEHLELAFDVDSDARPGLNDIVPANGLGTPQVDNVFSVAGADVIVTEFQGAVFTVLNPNTYTFNDVSPLPGADFDVELYLDHPEDLDGYSVEIGYDDVILTLEDVDVSPTEALLEDETPGDSDIEFLEVAIDNDAGTASVAAVFDSSPPFDSDKVIVAGTDQHILTFEFSSAFDEVEGGDTTTIEFIEGEVGNLVTYRGGRIALLPIVEDLDITFATPPDELPFVRGDSNISGRTDLADAIFTLKWIFSEGRSPSCMKSVDTNGDAITNIADPIVTVFWLFLEGNDPPAPFPDCGLEENAGPLSCDVNPDECQEKTVP